MKYLDLFTGIGGFTKAINDVLPEAECIGFSEIDKYAQQIYLKHFPNHKPYGDITKLTTDSISDFDLLVGGFPCQSFSIAGKRRGFEDTRGTLFFEIARILRDKRPTNFILENVAGLLSHDEGNTFKVIISTLDELGYFVEWQVLNSKNFGVPQNRERVFIIGHFRGEPRRKIFPIRQDSEADYVLPTLTTRYYNGQANGAYLRQISPSGGSQGERIYDSNGIAVTIASQAGGLGAKTGLYAVRDLTDSKSVNFPTIRAKGIQGQRLSIPVLTPDRVEKRQNGRRFKKDGDPSFTLTAQDKHGIFNGSRIRRLTPLECERLQGFPDGWTEGVSDSQRYKCLGNAVTVNVVREIIKRLYKS